MIAIGRAFVALLRGDGEATMAFAAQALAELGEGEWLLDSLAPRARRGGRVAPRPARGGRARHRLEHRTVAAPACTSWSTLWCQYLGPVQWRQGRLDAALETYRQALEAGTAAGRPGLPAAGSAYVGMAEVAYQRDELDTARQHSPRACGCAASSSIPTAGQRPGHAGVDPAGPR